MTDCENCKCDTMGYEAYYGSDVHLRETAARMVTEQIVSANRTTAWVPEDGGAKLAFALFEFIKDGTVPEPTVSG